MAVIIGETYQGCEAPSPAVRPFFWLTKHLGGMLHNQRNPSSFPDRVWQRHSALLDAGKRCRLSRAK